MWRLELTLLQLHKPSNDEVYAQQIYSFQLTNSRQWNEAEIEVERMRKATYLLDLSQMLDWSQKRIHIYTIHYTHQMKPDIVYIYEYVGFY